MSKRYTAGVVSSTPPTVNAAGASGVFTLEQQTNAQSTNNWPPYKVEKSLRFRSAASAYLSRTPSAAGSKQKWTFSCWFKKSANGVYHELLSASPSGGGVDQFFFSNSDALVYYLSEGSIRFNLTSTQVFRDPSAWYHLVLAVDTTQATSSDRAKLYVNGTQITSFTSPTYSPQNQNTYITAANLTAIGSQVSNGSINGLYPDGYMSEVYLIDGQQLTPSFFGGTDKDGNWSPIAYTGSYGTTGFYLNFKDVTSAATTGYDYSGNGNNWTLSGFNVSTANTSYDSMIDVPEDQSDGTANNRGNYCIINRAECTANGFSALNDGGLSLVTNGYFWTGFGGSVAVPPSGKWYWEFTGAGWSTASNWPNVFAGFMKVSQAFTPDPSDVANASLCGLYVRNDSQAVRFYDFANNPFSTNPTLSSSDADSGTYSIALDLDNNKLYLAYNGTYYASGNPSAGTNGLSITNPGEYVRPTVLFTGGAGGTLTSTVNFGQRPFAYAIPTGYKTINTYNIPDPTIKKPNQYMDVVTYTGDGTTSKTISGLNFQPDMVWQKSRSQTYRHNLYDAVRGFGQHLQPSFTDAENTVGTTVGTSFFLGATSTGFTVGVPTSGTYSGNLGTNENGTTYVGWAWNAGGSTVTNTAGSISSQVRANQTAGFSVVTYTGNGTIGATIGHGLGVTPSMLIVKQRTGGLESWQVYHSVLGATQYLLLNTTGAAASNINRWNNTSPTSTVFTVYNDTINNGNTNTYVAYCFAQVAGYSAFGKYTGNGLSDGPFIYTGFRPKYYIIKNVTNAQSWSVQDTSRNPYNVGSAVLFPNLSSAESTGTDFVDILSNGFKIRHTGASGNNNNSGDTYIYAAFAETPFKYARAR